MTISDQYRLDATTCSLWLRIVQPFIGRCLFLKTHNACLLYGKLLGHYKFVCNLPNSFDVKFKRKKLDVGI